MKTYLAVYSGALFLALCVTPLVIRLAYRLKAVNAPDARTIHSRPVPRIGGVAIFLCALVMVALVLFYDNAIGREFRSVRHEMVVFFISAGFIFCVGLYDDLRHMRATAKLIAQLAAAIALCLAGVQISSITVAHWLVIDLGWLSWPVTVLWIVGITNAVNLSDGLDGLAAGIAAIACGVIAVLAIYAGEVILAVMMLALLGSLTGFLYYNFNPAKVFMGDCGSMFVGFTIGAVSIMCAAKSEALVGLTLPLIALGVPIFDTFFSMVRRFLERRSIFSPDRSHFHHRLLEMGLHQRHVVIVIYAVTIAASGLGMFMILTRDLSTVVIFVSLLTLLFLLFRLAGSVRLRQSFDKLRHNYGLNAQRSQAFKSFEYLQLEFRNTQTFDQWWQSVCRAAGSMDFAEVALPVTNRDGKQRTFQWQTDTPGRNNGNTLKVRVPIKDRRSGRQLELTMNVRINGSLESAGHRVMLFSRLMDENGLHTLSNPQNRQYSD